VFIADGYQNEARVRNSALFKLLSDCRYSVAEVKMASVIYLIRRAEKEFARTKAVVMRYISSSSYSYRAMSCILSACLSVICLMSLSNFRTNVLKAIQMTWEFSISCHFCKSIIIYPIYMVSPCSSADSSPSYEILDLVDIA